MLLDKLLINCKLSTQIYAERCMGYFCTYFSCVQKISRINAYSTLLNIP